MKKDVGRAKKKIKVVPKARKAFQVKYDGQALPLEFVVATREKYEKFVVSNNLLKSCEEEYLETLEKKFKSSKEVDVKSKDGHMVLKWAAFNSVDKMFFFGDDLLCLMNGSYVQVVENVGSAPKHKTWNLFKAHSAAELIEGTKSQRSFTIQAVAGCPYTPTLAYVISNSPVIHVMAYPQMTRMAELRSFDEHGDYIDLHFGIGECLYALRGHPGNVLEIWSLRSRSILVSIPGSFYSNRTFMRLSPISYAMVTIDRGCQNVVRWALHCISPSDLLAYPQAVSLMPDMEHSIVDAAFTYEDDLYLLTDGGEIYYVDGNNEGAFCRLVQHPKNCSPLPEGRTSHNKDGCQNNVNQTTGWSSLVSHHGRIMMINDALGLFKLFKVIRKTYFEIEDVTTIGEDPQVAINTRANIFKTGSLVRDTTLIAVMNVNGLNAYKWNLEKLSVSNNLKGLINDIKIVRNHAIAVERWRLRVIGLEDGTTACTIPVPRRINKVLAHPFKDVIAVAMECEGSLYVFKMSGRTVEFVESFQQIFSTPIDLMFFSIRGDAFVVSSKLNEIGLFKVFDDGCVGLLTVKSVEHTVDSMSFVSYGDDHFVLVALANSSDTDHSTIYVYDEPALHCLSCIELQEKLFQLAESNEKGKCFGTSHSGLSVSTYNITLDSEGGGIMQATKTLKTYEDVCKRRMTADRNYLMVYGTEGCIDIFAQKDDNERIFSVTNNMFAFSGYVNAAFSLELKYVVGVHASGVVSCRSLKRRTKGPSGDDNSSSCALSKKDSGKGESKRDESSTSFFCTEEQNEKKRRNEFKATIFIHRHLIAELCGILNEEPLLSTPTLTFSSPAELATDSDSSDDGLHTESTSDTPLPVRRHRTGRKRLEGREWVKEVLVNSDRRGKDLARKVEQITSLTKPSERNRQLVTSITDNDRKFASKTCLNHFIKAHNIQGCPLIKTKKLQTIANALASYFLDLNPDVWLTHVAKKSESLISPTCSKYSTARAQGIIWDQYQTVKRKWRRDNAEEHRRQQAEKKIRIEERKSAYRFSSQESRDESPGDQVTTSRRGRPISDRRVSAELQKEVHAQEVKESIARLKEDETVKTVIRWTEFPTGADVVHQSWKESHAIRHHHLSLPQCDVREYVDLFPALKSPSEGPRLVEIDFRLQHPDVKPGSLTENLRKIADFVYRKALSHGKTEEVKVLLELYASCKGNELQQLSTVLLLLPFAFPRGGRKRCGQRNVPVNVLTSASYFVKVVDTNLEKDKYHELLVERNNGTVQPYIICVGDPNRSDSSAKFHISAVQNLKEVLDLSFQEELSTAFSEIVSSKNLMAIKHRKLKEFNRRLRESIVRATREGLEALDLYARRYRDLFEDKDTGKGVVHRKHYTPSIIKGVREHSYNSYKSSASAIEEESAEGILLYCTDLVTVSTGFDKYITPRWLRNAGSAAEMSSIAVHARKRGVDEDADRPKMDLNKKITEAFENFAVYFIKKRESEMKKSEGAVKEEEDKTTGAELPLLKIGTGLGEGAEIFLKKEIMDVGGPAPMDFAPEDGSNVESGEESSDEGRIPDASNDGSEEEAISSDSFSSGSTFELPGEENDEPGSRSSYLIRLLERKEAKKTRRFEMKDGMLKCYYHFTDNVKAFIKKFHGSSSHEFLHVFPLCFCPDETDSVFNNHVQFLYSRYFVEGLREHFNCKFEEVYLTRDESLNFGEEENRSSVNEEGVEAELLDYEREPGRFMIEPLKPVSPLVTPLQSNVFRQMDDGVHRPLTKIEICPAAWKGSDKLNILVEWMKLATIPACGNCHKEASSERFEHWLEGAIPTLQDVSGVEDIECDQVSKPTQQLLKLVLNNMKIERPDGDHSSEIDADDKAKDLLSYFKWPEADALETPVSELVIDEENEPDGADLLKLLDEKDKQFLKPTVTNRNLSFDYIKRRKWHVQGQVLSETLQLTTKNYKAQMIGRLMGDCATARSYQAEIVAYLKCLNDRSTEISMFFGELLHLYNEMKPQLNELNHIKKVFQRVSRKHSVPGLSQHIERMDTFQFEQQDGGSADYLEDLIRTRSIFAESFQDLSYCKISMEKVLESCKHLGFSTSFNRTQYNIWRTFFSWKSQENELPGEETVQEEPQVYFKGNLKEDIFQIATDLYVIGITVYIMTRSLLLRLKSLYETALYIKKQYRTYKVCSIKLQLLENSLENCAKEWINYERVLLHFKNIDMYKSYKSPNLSSLSSLVPFEYIGWEIPLIASRADKILLRKVKKKSTTPHSKSNRGLSPQSPSPRGNGGSNRRRAHAQRKESDAVKFGAGALDESEDELAHSAKPKHSKVSSRTKTDHEASEQQKKQKYLKNKSFFDVSLEDFAKHLEERTEKELMEDMKNPDLASALKEEPLDTSQNSRISSAENVDGDVKMRFCENPIYTNISHLIDQDQQIKSLEKEYYEKLLSLMRAKEDFRKYKADISNVRTRMASLAEEYATIKKYIVSRDEAHLITNFPLMADRIKETKMHHETESKNLSAEVRRSLRLIKKGKYDAVEWLMSRLNAVKGESQLSDEEQVSKNSSSVSEQLKSSYCSEQKNATSKSNVSISDEKSTENLEEVRQETSGEEETKIDESLQENASKIQKIDRMVAMVLSLGDGKTSYSLCGVHSQSVPPFCCLQEYLNQNLDIIKHYDENRKTAVVAKESQIILDADPNVITLTKSDSDAASGILMNQEELGVILSSFKTSKREPGCEFLSDKEEQEFESSSHQSSLKMDATLGSWTDSELEEVVESGTYSSQDKLNSAVETLMKNKPEIIRQLTHKYIMEKCGELFIDQRSEQSSFESVDGNDDLTKLKTTAEHELVEHRRELMSLYEECSSVVHSENKADANRRKQTLYEARLRSEQLMEIRVLKDRIQEKMASVENMENELERMRLKKYPTFEH